MTLLLATDQRLEPAPRNMIRGQDLFPYLVGGEGFELCNVNALTFADFRYPGRGATSSAPLVFARPVFILWFDWGHFLTRFFVFRRVLGAFRPAQSSGYNSTIVSPDFASRCSTWARVFAISLSRFTLAMSSAFVSFESFFNSLTESFLTSAMSACLLLAPGFVSRQELPVTSVTYVF